VRRLALFLLSHLLLAGGCASLPASSPPAQESSKVTVWQGKVVIRGKKHIPAGETLVVRPGTTVVFDYLDTDNDGLGESGIFVEGSIRAEGTEANPILFVPGAVQVRPGLWEGIRIERGAASRFAVCRFAGAQWALHAHFTDLLLEGSRFDGNRGGIKFRGGPILIRGNVFDGNGTAVRYWESAPRIVGNVIRGNGTGIFSREGSGAGLVQGNDFIANSDYNIKLGELQERDVDARGNYWGTADRLRIEELIFDRQDASYLGRVLYEPFARAPLSPVGTAAGSPAPPGSVE